MLNAEKFKKEISECIDEYNSGRFSISKDCAPRFKYCDTTYCNDCMFDEQEGYCSLRRMKWLLSEYKEPVKLTRFERDILEYALKNTDYRFITRDEEDKLYFYSTKPRKYNRYWQYLAQNQRRLLSDDLFPFVKWEDDEPTSIKKVLKNCVVIKK